MGAQVRFWPFRRRRSAEIETTSVEPSVIAHGVTVDGAIATGGELQIAGTVRGDIRAQSCYVDGDGAVHGEILAADIHIDGRVIGPLVAQRVRLTAGAHVEGDIVTETISIEDGAFIDGAIRRPGDTIGKGKARGRPEPAFPVLESMETDDPQTYRPLRAVRPR